MGRNIAGKNKFHKGVNKDVNENDLTSNTLRKSENVSLTESGLLGALTNLRGTVLESEINFKVDNVLNSTSVKIKYDYNCDRKYEVENESIVYFVYSETNYEVGMSEIYFYDTVEKQFNKVVVNGDLNFPKEGTIETVIYFNNNNGFIEFTDGVNPPRVLPLKWSCGKGLGVVDVGELDLIKKAPIGTIKVEGTINEGSISSGSYSFFFRGYNSKTCRASKISPITNPISVTDFDCEITEGDKITGEIVGKKVSKSIQLKIDGYTPQHYDKIQIGVFKYIDGSKEIPQTAYLLEPRYLVNNSFLYTGNETEYQIPTENIVIDDAPIKTFSTLDVVDNKTIAGDIQYHSLLNDNGDVQFDNAYTIHKDLPADIAYKCDMHKKDYQGHFRGEQYAYYAVYHDENGNWGKPRPLDFSNQSFNTHVRTIGPATIDGNEIVFNSPHDLSEGDYVRTFLSQEDASRVVRIINAYKIEVDKDYGPSSGLQTIIEETKGAEGNFSNNWAWKFPDRDVPEHTILNENGDISVLGLRVEGIRNHPSWAKGMLIVRQKRKKNIIGQTIHIPTMFAKGTVTPYVDEENDPSYDDKLDYFAPKIFKYGTARNISIVELDSPKPIFLPDVNMSTITPQIPIGSSLKDDLYDEIEFNLETPKLIAGLFPFYMYNNKGEPFSSLEIEGVEELKIIDGVALYRKNYKRDDEKWEHVNVYSALNAVNYFYDRTMSDPNHEAYNFKITDIEGLPQKINVTRSHRVALASPFFQVSPNLLSGSKERHIDIYGNGQQLTEQQGVHPSVMVGDGLFTNVIRNQRLLLLETDERLYDLSVYNGEMIKKGLFFSDDGMFTRIPPSRSGNENIYQTDWMYNEALFIDQVGYPTESGRVGAYAFILNLEKGLSDDRYSKFDVENQLISTGTYVQLSENDIEANTGIDLDIFGGDCFITKQVVKINQNTPTVQEYNPFDDALEGTTANSGQKTGSYAINTEVLEYFVESEVNTSIQGQKNIYPEDNTEEGLTGQWIYPYHPNYSQENNTKIFATEPISDCSDNNGIYPSRYIWSETRIESESNPFLDTLGFDTFKALNFSDMLNTEYGKIEKVIDMGGDNAVHFIQERKVFYQPIGVDIVKTGDNQNITLQAGGETIGGRGGVYLPYDVGCQDKRTIQLFNGLVFMVDNYGRKVVQFGTRGSNYSVISSKGLRGEFNELLKNNIPSHLFRSGIYKDSGNEKYIISRQGEFNWVWDFNNQLWETNIVTKKNIKDFTWANKNLYAVSKNLETMFNGRKNEFFGDLMPTKFAYIANPLPDLDKVINTIVGNLENFGENDEVIVRVDNDYDYGIKQISNVTASRSIRTRNHRVFINDIVDDETYGRLRGQDFYVEFIFNQDENDKVLRVYSVITNMKESFRN